MRRILLLTAALCASCASSPSGPDFVDETYTSAEILEAAADELQRNGDSEADAVLIAAGPEAISHVRPLLSSDNPEVRERARLVIAALAREGDLAPTDRVELILTEVLREGGAPHARLLAAERLRRMGPAARIQLERAGSSEGDRGKLARRLLLLISEEP